LIDIRIFQRSSVSIVKLQTSLLEFLLGAQKIISINYIVFSLFREIANISKAKSSLRNKLVSGHRFSNEIFIGVFLNRIGLNVSIKKQCIPEVY
jgi:hypothetical protein